MENNIKKMSFNFEKNKLDSERELLINNFIKMFPKAKLENILEINKFYNDKKVNEISYNNQDNDINKLINEYLYNKIIKLNKIYYT